jgi:hypothetical protein
LKQKENSECNPQHPHCEEDFIRPEAVRIAFRFAVPASGLAEKNLLWCSSDGRGPVPTFVLARKR